MASKTLPDQQEKVDRDTKCTKNIWGGKEDRESKSILKDFSVFFLFFITKVNDVPTQGRMDYPIIKGKPAN